MQPINDLLSQVINNKRQQLLEEKKALSHKDLENMLKKPLSKKQFSKNLKNNGKLNIIAEYKKASPSMGIINQNLKIDYFGKQAYQGQAAAVSILTERKYFLGNETDVEDFKKICDLPILRKDFILDEYDIIKTAVLGADAMLLICAVLDNDELRRFFKLAKELELEVLVEVHNRQELDNALELGANIIGINNRDLRTFEVDIKTTQQLIKYIPDNCIKVSESGIKTQEDAKYIKSLGADAVLVGTAFSKSLAISELLKTLSV